MIVAGAGEADAVAVARHRGKVADGDQLIALRIVAREREHRVVVIVDHQPLEAVRAVVALVQRRLLPVAVV